MSVEADTRPSLFGNRDDRESLERSSVYHGGLGHVDWHPETDDQLPPYRAAVERVKHDTLSPNLALDRQMGYVCVTGMVEE